ncbi:MAG: class 3 adenylate cyclase/tetratricopeptide (TPR) repeat protein, partial [Gammaproteobacteria bacterium]
GAPCSGCGHENLLGETFCTQCGTATDGHAAPPKMGYTPKHLADKILNQRSAMTGERKQVSVLFVDLRGSMDAAEQLDEERWHQILDSFFSLLGEHIHRFEGTINQYTGDGVMALFGAPIAHEDHAQRACHSALALTDALLIWAQQLRLSDGVNLSARLGLNSGEVIVGAIGDDLRMDYTAQGHTVGLAARMEHIAEPGTTYLTDHVAQLVDGYFDLEPLGEMDIKGVSDPIRAFKLLGLGPIRTRLERSQQRGMSSFVGRESEFNQLQQVIEQDSPGVFRVVGDAGMGKSRLCQEFVKHCVQQQVTVYQCNGFPYGDALPLKPVRDLLRAVYEISSGDTAQQARQKIVGSLALNNQDTPEIRGLLFDFLEIETTTNASNPNVENRLERLLLTFLHCGSCVQGRKVLILVDDLHWMDVGSKEFFSALADRIAGHQTMLLFNYRGYYDDKWLDPKHPAKLTLQPLVNEQIEDLCSDILGQDESVIELALAIAERASGNPFFAEELMRSLADGGQLEGTRGAYRYNGDAGDLGIPSSIQSLIAARIDRLDDSCKSVLQHAAVLGTVLEPDNLHALFDNDGIDDALAHLQSAKMLSVNSKGLLEFQHPLIQEVAYHGQLREQRDQIHVRVAEHYERQLQPGEPAGEKTVLLSHHWQRARDYEKAAEWMVKAASWAAERDAFEAIRRFTQAADLLDNVAESTATIRGRITARAGIIRQAGFVKVAQNIVDSAYQDAKVLAERVGDLAGLAELNLSYGQHKLRGANSDEGISYTNAALALAEESGDDSLIGRFRTPILVTYFSAGRLQEGLDLLTNHSKDWTTVPITSENFPSRSFYGLFVGYKGQLQEGVAEIKQAILVAQQYGDSPSWFHGNLSELYIMVGDPVAALSQAEMSLERAEASQSPYFKSLAVRAKARALTMSKRAGEALELLDGIKATVEPGELAAQFKAIHLVETANAQIGLGNLTQARLVTEEAISESTDRHSRISEIRARLTRCELETLDPDGQSTLQDIERVHELIEETGAAVYSPVLFHIQARTFASQNNHTKAVELTEKAILGYRQYGAFGHSDKLSEWLKNTLENNSTTA